MSPYILNCSFIVDRSHSKLLLETIPLIILPAIKEVESYWLHVEAVQGKPLSVDEPQNLALQCRFPTAEQREEFRSRILAPRVVDLLAKMPQDSCMIFDTCLQEIEL